MLPVLSLRLNQKPKLDILLPFDISQTPVVTVRTTVSRGIYYHELTIIPAWISNHMSNKVFDEFTYPFPKFNGYRWRLAMDKWLHPTLYDGVITYTCWD